MKVIKHLLPILFCLLSFSILSQAKYKSYRYPAKPKVPAGYDTIYHPFYNGVQMIEIKYQYVDESFHLPEHIFSNYSAYKHHCFIDYLNFINTGPNIYLFRDTSGKIIKAYNTLLSPEKITAGFRHIPKYGRMDTFIFHDSKPRIFYTQQQTFPNGYYKVYTMKNLNKKEAESFYATAGLIDSLGTLKLPMIFKDIYPLNEKLLAFGIIDTSIEPIIASQYKHFQKKYPNGLAISGFDYYKPRKVYLLREGVMVNIDTYDAIPFLANMEKIAMFQKNGRWGFINNLFEEITVPLYDVCEYLEKPGLYRVSRDCKWGYVDQYAKEVIPCIYDSAGLPYRGFGMVRLKDRWLWIDTTGKFISPCPQSLLPKDFVVMKDGSIINLEDEQLKKTYWLSLVPKGVRIDSLEKSPYNNHLFNFIPSGKNTVASRKSFLENRVAFRRMINGIPCDGYYADYVFTGKIWQLTFEGTYKDGVLKGPATFYFTSLDSFNTREVPFASAFGFGSFFKSGGVKASGVFENGEMMGEWLYYNFKGEANESRTYVQGKQYPEQCISYRNDIISSKAFYKTDDKRPSEIFLYYTHNNSLSRSEEIISKDTTDSLHGPGYTYQITRYHETGVIEAKGKHIITATRSYDAGIWEYYNKEGKLDHTHQFEEE